MAESEYTNPIADEAEATEKPAPAPDVKPEPPRAAQANPVPRFGRREDLGGILLPLPTVGRIYEALESAPAGRSIRAALNELDAVLNHGVPGLQ